MTFSTQFPSLIVQFHERRLKPSHPLQPLEFWCWLEIGNHWSKPIIAKKTWRLQLEAQLWIQTPKSSENKGFKEWVASRSWRLEYIAKTQLGGFCKYMYCTVLINGLFGAMTSQRGFSARFSGFPLCKHFNGLVGDRFSVFGFVFMFFHACLC